MTFREAIQIQIKAMQEIYDNANGLRDVADGNMQKEAFNEIRRQMPGLWHLLQRIDNSMPESQAQYKLKGNYSISVNEKSV